MRVELKVLAHAKELYSEMGLPTYATKGSAAIDLIAAEDCALSPGQCVSIKTGIAVSIMEPNVCAVVLPRSGLGGKYGLVLGNLVGLIDNDYQGEISCFMWNRTDSEMIYVNRGMRFAQMMFLPFLKAEIDLVKEFSHTTERGTAGFGSTGQ